MLSFAIAAIFQNEAPYLREWIEFHRLMGCERFYLFDHLSTDHFQEVLAPYQGLVELHAWPLPYEQWSDWAQVQCLAYERAIYLAKNRVRWLALIDIDEFLFPTKKESLLSCLEQYEQFGGVGVNWQVFGTSQVARIPENRLLIEMLQMKLPEQAAQNRKIKSVVRPERVAGCASSHFVEYQNGFYQVNTDGVQFAGRDSPYVQVDTLRINHYQVRDVAYLQEKKIPRTLRWWNTKTKENWETYYQSFNVERDKLIFRFVAELKKRVDS